VKEDAPDKTSMVRVCLQAMNSVNSDLSLTTEAPEDFPRKRLPTLEFVIWMVVGILYYYYTVMQKSAMSETREQE
jgi:hypothetical protein